MRSIISKTTEKNGNKIEKNSLNQEKLAFDLSIHPDMEAGISKLQRELLEEEIAKLHPVKDATVSIIGIYAYTNDENIEVNLYIRNGLNTGINFCDVPLKIVNSKGKLIARQVFDLREVGDIPSCNVRPWKIYFDKKNLLVDEVPSDDWMIVFDNDLIAEKTVKLEIENVNDYEIEKYSKTLEKLPPIKNGEINISVFEIKFRKNEDLALSVMIRNATIKKLKMDKIPVTIKDEFTKKTIAYGEFKINDGVVNPFKAQVRNLIFKKDELATNDFKVENLAVIFNRV